MLVSKLVSLPRGVSVVPEVEAAGVPFTMPADCELLVFLPLFVFSIGSVEMRSYWKFRDFREEREGLL